MSWLLPSFGNYESPALGENIANGPLKLCPRGKNTRRRWRHCQSCSHEICTWPSEPRVTQKKNNIKEDRKCLFHWSSEQRNKITRVGELKKGNTEKLSWVCSWVGEDKSGRGKIQSGDSKRISAL